jgi:histone acetyltransferase (RNA polymerase elongator complex component)
MTSKILPVFIPFAGCRNRCVYCNQSRITGVASGSLIESASEQISKCLSWRTEWSELAYYGGSFTCLDRDTRLSLYNLAHSKEFSVLRFSTSPDCVNAEVLSEAYDNGVRTVELGVQSLSDDVLRLNKRPYKAETAIEAVKAVQKRFTAGVQIMTAMYGETAYDVIKTADDVAALKPAAARIYPTVVMADTELEELYSSSVYAPPSPAETLIRTAYAYCALTAAGTKVIRTGLQYTPETSASVRGGFYSPSTGEMVKTLIYLVYLNKCGDIRTTQETLNSFYGHRALARKHFGDKISASGTRPPDMEEICRRAKEHLFEDNSGKIQRETASYAEELVSPSHH